MFSYLIYLSERWSFIKCLFLLAILSLYLYIVQVSFI